MPLSSAGNGSQLRKVIELDEVSGRFELDADGYMRWYPSPDEKASLEQYIGAEIDRVEREERTRFDAHARNRETYGADKIQLENDGGRAIVPSPIARIPADQIIASTQNSIMQPRHLFSFDPHFDATYPVLMPTPEYDANDPETASFANVPAGTPYALSEDAETISRCMEAGMNFIARQRLDFEERNHRVIDACTIEGEAWIKTCRKKKTRTIIRPRAASKLVDLDDEEEIEYASGSQIHWVFVHGTNVLRSNRYQEIDDLEWLAERDPETPDSVRASYASDDYFLLDDEKNRADEIERLAKSTSIVIDEARERADETTKKTAPPENRESHECDRREVWIRRWLRVKDEATGKTRPQRFLMQVFYHHGARKMMAAFRNPYDHQRFIHTPFNQFLDGSSTVGIVRHHQSVGTYAMQSELKNAHIANNHLYWYDPTASDTATFFKANPTIYPGSFIPGKEGVDWGIVRGGSEHFSLLPLMQWNASEAQALSKIGDYETRGSAPSHTSPNTVSMLLERGGQTSLLFLGMLNRAWSRCVRLYLETARQYQPLGEVIPVRDPKTRIKTNIPFRYPIGEALDNFNITLTAASDAASRERSPETTMSLMGVFQQHISSMMGPVGALMDPATTDAQASVYLKMIESGQALLDRLVSTTRVDENTFNMMPAVLSVVEEKRQLLAQAKAAQEAEAANAANQASVGGGVVPAAEGAGDMGELAGIAEQPGMAGSAAPPPEAGVPPTIAP